MKFLLLSLQIAKLVLMLLFGFIRLHYAFQKSKKAFERSLLKEELPAPLVKGLLKEYSSMRGQLTGFPAILSDVKGYAAHSRIRSGHRTLRG